MDIIESRLLHAIVDSTSTVCFRIKWQGDKNAHVICEERVLIWRKHYHTQRICTHTMTRSCSANASRDIEINLARAFLWTRRMNCVTVREARTMKWYLFAMTHTFSDISGNTMYKWSENTNHRHIPTTNHAHEYRILLIPSSEILTGHMHEYTYICIYIHKMFRNDRV